MNTSIISKKQLSEDTEVIILISHIERLKTKIKEENEKINSCIHILEQENSNYCQYMKSLEIDVSHIRDNLNLSFSQKEEIDEITDTNIRDELKTLYRKISSKCHPDKTEDLNFHELFRNAKQAYSKLDYSELKKIYEEVFGETTNSRPDNNSSQIANLKKQLRKIENDYVELTKKNTFIMTSLYNSDKPINRMKSKKIFLDLLFAKIFELETLKSNLTP